MKSARVRLLLCADAAGWRITGRCHRAKEVFGPVVSVTLFDNEEQVVNWRPQSVRTCTFGMDEGCGQGASRQRVAAIWLFLVRPISCW
ncbi:hypothetical protein ACNKHM_27655 [Shigella sonnei]